MSGGADRHKEVFREEAYELLSELEGSLLELEENPNDEELIGRIFRAMHTIKGSGAMFGFNDIVSFTHELETAFDHVRNKKMQVTKELVGLTLNARDIIREMLDSPEGFSNGQAAQDIIARLRQLLPDSLPSEPKSGNKTPGAAPHPALSGNSGDVTYRIRFRPGKNILRNGTNPLFLIEELRALGDCTAVAQTDSVPLLDEFDPEACYIYWDIILTTSQGINAIKDVFIFIDGDSELKIDAVDADAFDRASGYKKIGEILVEKGDISTEDLKNALGQQVRIGQVLVESGMVDEGKVVSALAEQQHVREKRNDASQQSSSIRVPSHKLDVLADLIGELVTVQARLSRTAAFQNNPELLAIAEMVERLTEELRDNAMSIRLMPIGTAFGKLKRVVRDLSAELEKEAEMETEGAETELDKSLLEKLNDPLVHLIRNSIDHGIELPNIREAAGKPRKGTVRLSAVHSGSGVLITISDDGKGLDTEAIRSKAVERGLIAADSEIPDKELFQFIFSSGFSTAEKVTKVSGRGVGMDVVKKNLDSLRGTIDIESEKGKGTSIRLKVPLTLAIIDGLLVQVSDEFFILPLSSVEECIELTKRDEARSHGRQIANLRGEIIPYIRLREFFDIPGGAPEIEQIIITESMGRRVGFVVDNVIGEHQTVIKALGNAFRDIKWISGATILGDGRVALILDINQAVESAEVKSATLR